MVAYNRDDIADADALIETWIDRYGRKGDARIKGTGVHVWALIGYLQGAQENWDIERAARDYQLPVEAVRAAVAYYDRYAMFIEDVLEANRM
jgi:uncharacterized protein (DUF433 family)